MIERMKKVSLLIYHQARDTFLTELQKLGVVHVEIDKTRTSDEILATREEVSRMHKAARSLSSIAVKCKESLPTREYSDTIISLLDQIEEQEEKLGNLETKREHIQKDIEQLTPWGDFKPNHTSRLTNKGIGVTFYTIAKSAFKKIDTSQLPLELINEARGTLYCILIVAPEEIDSEIDSELIETFKQVALPARLPKNSLSELQGELTDINSAYSEQQKSMLNLTAYSYTLARAVTAAEDKLQYQLADTTLKPEVDGRLLYITGWVPKRSFQNVNSFLEKKDVIFFMDDPVEGDVIPVKLRNDPFSRLFEPITKMNSLPQYNEIDPTPFFAPFFALFFGMCLADVGYGLIILSIVIIGLVLKWKNKNLRGVLLLGFVLGLTTVIGGIIFNTFFGADNVSYFIGEGILPAWLTPAILFENDLNGAMGIAVLLGIIHILIGFCIRLANKVRIYGFIGALQPFGTILTFLGVVNMVTPAVVKGGIYQIGPFNFNWFFPYPELTIGPASAIGLIVFIVGVLLVLLFNNLKMKIFIRPAPGLWEMYNILTGLLGDTLSYIRLFALGLAGGLLGQAFNDIAFMIRDSGQGVGAVIGMILVLLFGHTINFGLAALSAFVHPLRLILLEFYNAVEFTGGATAYSPFKNRTITTNIKKGAS